MKGDSRSKKIAAPKAAGAGELPACGPGPAAKRKMGRDMANTVMGKPTAPKMGGPRSYPR